MFGKKLQIGEGDKYDFTKVSTSEVTREEIVKKNNRLIDIFKHFDTDKDGKLNSAEMAKAMEAIDSFDTSGNDKLSKKELQKAAEQFNEAKNLTGDNKVKAKDFKEFVKNMFAATKGDTMADTQKVLEEYENQQAQLKKQAFWAELDKAAADAGFEPTKNEGVYWSEQEKMYAKYDAENKSLRYAKWNNETQEFEFMTDEEINAARAANQDPVEKEEETPELHKYTVQPGESFTTVIKKSLAAQGIENPTDEQIAQAKEQFKKDNPDAVKTLKNGYEFLDVGAEVNLQGEVESPMTSEEAEIAWAKANPNLVSEAWIKDHPDVKLDRTPPAGEDPVDPAGGDPKAKGTGDPKTPEQRAADVKAMADDIAPDYTPKEKLNDRLQNGAKEVANNQEKGKKAKENIDNILDYEWTGADSFRSAMNNKEYYNKYTIAYIVDENIAERIDNVLGLDKKDVYKYILTPLKEAASEVPGVDKDYIASINEDMSLEEMQEVINNLSKRIKDADKFVTEEANKNLAAVNDEAAELKKLKNNEEFIKKSNLSLARVVDMVENEPDSVTFTKKENGREYAELPDGTGIVITRDDDGNIDMVEILNPGGPDSSYDIKYKPNGTMYFDPDGKSVDSSTYKESIQGGFDFAKIKALAERIFGAKPKEE